MGNIFDPRFELRVPYSKAEFIYRLDVLITTVQDDPFALAFAENNKIWAQGHDDRAIFVWDFDTLGTLSPFATTTEGAPVFIPPKQEPPRTLS